MNWFLYPYIPFQLYTTVISILVEESKNMENWWPRLLGCWESPWLSYQQSFCRYYMSYLFIHLKAWRKCHNTLLIMPQWEQWKARSSDICGTPPKKNILISTWWWESRKLHKLWYKLGTNNHAVILLYSEMTLQTFLFLMWMKILLYIRTTFHWREAEEDVDIWPPLRLWRWLLRDTPYLTHDLRTSDRSHEHKPS